jgi:ubiquinone/menaquinone biosynthesis C-methylase UbiE
LTLFRIVSEPSISKITEWCPPLECCDPAWEAAYRRFETPAEERAKFLRRLRRFGAHRWDRNLVVLELFCGRGNALRAWETLGFTQLSGVDLSRALLKQYDGPARLYQGDCRDLRLPAASVDVVAIHGGLHHLPEVKRDLPAVLDEVARVLKPGGRFLVVEPWRTPFLDLLHLPRHSRVLRKCWSRYDAFAEMTAREERTYFAWLGVPEFIEGELNRRFSVELRTVGWGKLNWLGRI